MKLAPSLERVMITGGAGFLGSHLCDRLIELGCWVTCLDNLLTGSTDNIAHLLDHPKFEFIDCDVSESVSVDGDLDAVLHFASPASPRDYLELPIDTLKVGSLGTMATLDLAEAKGARYLLASTSEVYGDPLVKPQPESYWGNVNPVSPRGVYDEAKRFAEAMTMAYHRYHGVDTRIVRIFNTYGPRMRPGDGRVISNFIVQALRGESLTVYGNGSQTRSFCYVSDTVEGITRLLFKEPDTTVDEWMDRSIFLYRDPADGEESIHEPTNVGNPHELSIMDVTDLILKLTGSDSVTEFHPLPVDDPRVRRPDISKAQRMLGWEPEVSIEVGLGRAIQFHSRLATVS